MEEKTKVAVYTVKEVMEILRLSRNAIYNAIYSGEIKTIHIGDRYLIPAKTIEELLSNGTKRTVDVA